jgi:cold shock CspA family protein
MSQTAQSQQTNQVSESQNGTVTNESYVGQIKWFNNRIGYGFITIISESTRRGEDIFVHQQHITPKTSEYRSLQQGEYVSFQLGNPDTNSESAKHATQAINVTGVFGGSLMCDQLTRRSGHNNSENSQSHEESRNTSEQGSRFPRRDGPQFSRGESRVTPRGGSRGGARGGFSSNRPPRQNTSS